MQERVAIVLSKLVKQPVPDSVATVFESTHINSPRDRNRRNGGKRSKERGPLGTAGASVLMYGVRVSYAELSRIMDDGSGRDVFGTCDEHFLFTLLQLRKDIGRHEGFTLIESSLAFEVGVGPCISATGLQPVKTRKYSACSFCSRPAKVR